MKVNKQIRKGVFETNSSSTHSICVACEENITLPDSVYFKIGEFGWEVDTVFDTPSYVYTALLCNERYDDIKKLTQWLEESGVKPTFEEPLYRIFEFDGKMYTRLQSGEIDHSEELPEFLNAIMANKHHCFEFLFSPKSFVQTGNDNSGPEAKCNVNYPHKEYYKGN